MTTEPAIGVRFLRSFDIVPDPKPLRLDWVHVAAGPKMRLWKAPNGVWVLTIPPRVYTGELIDVEHLTFNTFDRGVQAVGQFASTARLGLWRYQTPERDTQMAVRETCRNRRCAEQLEASQAGVPFRHRGVMDVMAFRFGLCPSCWWMAKTSFAVGSMTIGTLAVVGGMLARWLL